MRESGAGLRQIMLESLYSGFCKGCMISIELSNIGFRLFSFVDPFVDLTLLLFYSSVASSIFQFNLIDYGTKNNATNLGEFTVLTMLVFETR